MAVYAGGGGGGGGLVSNANPTFYISTTWGKDTNTGAFDSPFQTFNGLNTSLANLAVQPSGDVPFQVFVEIGTYNEMSNVGVFYPNCYYTFMGPVTVYIDGDYIELNQYIPDLTLSTWYLGLDGLLTMGNDCNFRGSRAGIMTFQNIVACPQFNYIGQGEGSDTITMTNCNMSIGLTDCNATIQLGYFASITLASSADEPQINMFGVSYGSLSLISGQSLYVYTVGCTNYGVLTNSGSGAPDTIQLITDAASLPVFSLISMNGSTITNFDNGYGINLGAQVISVDTNLQPNTSYVTTAGSNVTLTLFTTNYPIGSENTVTCANADGSWTVATSASGQVIDGTSGEASNTSLVGTGAGASATFICVDGEAFQVVSTRGTVTFT